MTHQATRGQRWPNGANDGPKQALYWCAHGQRSTPCPHCSRTK